jgi:methylase of polypeptide subunit release factors
VSADLARRAFERVGYTVAGVRELLGPVAGGALARDEIVPALRLTGGSELGSYVRLFWLQVPVAENTVGDLQDLVAAGLVERSAGEVRALLRVEPVEGAAGEHLGLVVSDLRVRPGTGGVLRPDHVVGTGGASASLGRLAVHRPVENALDLGTGSGVQALYLRDRLSGRLTATDVNERALTLARMTFGLSGINDVETLHGSLFAPVRDRSFDLIVSNPPFVVAPPGRRLTYRESGLTGDEVCRRLVTEAPRHLTDGGWCQLLGNWLHVEGEPWEERLAGWVSDLGCDAWIVQRDVQDPAEYAELWLRDSVETGTPAYRARYETWLDHFAAHKVTGIGFGWISLRKGGSAVRVEEIAHPVEEPVGAYVTRVLDGLAAALDLDVSTARLRTAEGLLQEQIGPPGAEDPERIVLRQTRALRRAAGVGTVEAALAGVCDGTIPLPPLLDAIAQLTGDPSEAVRAHAQAVLPELLADGFFETLR